MYFNQEQRQIIIEDNSLYASRMKLHIADAKLRRTIDKSNFGKFMYKIVDLLERLLTKNK